MKIIVPIRPRSLDHFKELLETISIREDEIDVVEVWLDEVGIDLLSVPAFVSMDDLGVDLPDVHFLGVCKMKLENGLFEGKEEDRLQILQKFLDLGGDCVDLDVFRNDAEIIEEIDSDKLFLSFHDFEGVPDDLDDLFLQMQEFVPLVYKFAVTTNTKEDLARFLEFVESFDEGVPAIFTTMGDLGAVGRRKIKDMGKSWGAFYALDEDSKTAPGQLILGE